MAQCGIAFGGNVGKVETAFRRAQQTLAAHNVRVKAFSSVHTSAPMGVNAGAEYSNAAALAETEHAPQDVLRILHDTEQQLGRERSTRWGPRTLDLDLLFFDDISFHSPQLVLPHPCCWYRRFVLEPLCEIAPNWRHPLLNESAQDLLNACNQQPLRLVVQGNSINGSPIRKITSLVQAGYATDRVSIQAMNEAAAFSGEFASITFRERQGDSDETQPQNFRSRTIELLYSESPDRDVLVQALHDVITAILG